MGGLKLDNAKDILNFAKMTETAERYEDMCLAMGQLVKYHSEHPDEGGLDVEARNMLSVAYKNVVGNFRTARRTFESDKNSKNQQLDSSTCAEYTKFVETQLENKCNEVINLLDSHLVDKGKVGGELNAKDKSSDGWLDQIKDPQGNIDTEKLTTLQNKVKENKTLKEEMETQVFYLKMCGDYFRYLAEFKQEDASTLDEDKVASVAVRHYNAASEIAKISLAPTHPTRLGLALNASVCYYEINKDKEKACKLAKQAFDEAIQKLDSLNDATYKDSTLIMQLLRDNLTIWTSDADNTERED